MEVAEVDSSSLGVLTYVLPDGQQVVQNPDNPEEWIVASQHPQYALPAEEFVADSEQYVVEDVGEFVTTSQDFEDDGQHQYIVIGENATPETYIAGTEEYVVVSDAGSGNFITSGGQQYTVASTDEYGHEIYEQLVVEEVPSDPDQEAPILTPQPSDSRCDEPLDAASALMSLATSAGNDFYVVQEEEAQDETVIQEQLVTSTNFGVSPYPRPYIIQESEAPYRTSLPVLQSQGRRTEETGVQLRSSRGRARGGRGRGRRTSTVSDRDYLAAKYAKRKQPETRFVATKTSSGDTVFTTSQQARQLSLKRGPDSHRGDLLRLLPTKSPAPSLQQPDPQQLIAEILQRRIGDRRPMLEQPAADDTQGATAVVTSSVVPSVTSVLTASGTATTVQAGMPRPTFQLIQTAPDGTQTVMPIIVMDSNDNADLETSVLQDEAGRRKPTVKDCCDCEAIRRLRHQSEGWEPGCYCKCHKPAPAPATQKFSTSDATPVVRNTVVLPYNTVRSPQKSSPTKFKIPFARPKLNEPPLKTPKRSFGPSIASCAPPAPQAVEIDGHITAAADSDTTAQNRTIAEVVHHSITDEQLPSSSTVEVDSDEELIDVVSEDDRHLELVSIGPDLGLCARTRPYRGRWRRPTVVQQPSSFIAPQQPRSFLESELGLTKKPALGRPVGPAKPARQASLPQQNRAPTKPKVARKSLASILDDMRKMKQAQRQPPQLSQVSSSGRISKTPKRFVEDDGDDSVGPVTAPRAAPRTKPFSTPAKKATAPKQATVLTKKSRVSAKSSSCRSEVSMVKKPVRCPRCKEEIRPPQHDNTMAYIISCIQSRLHQPPLERERCQICDFNSLVLITPVEILGKSTPGSSQGSSSKSSIEQTTQPLLTAARTEGS